MKPKLISRLLFPGREVRKLAKETLQKIQVESKEKNARVDRAMATVNGEVDWFLCVQRVAKRATKGTSECALNHLGGKHVGSN